MSTYSIHRRSVDNVIIRKATATEIANYASTIRTNADQLTTGLQSTCLTLDGAGVPTAYTEGQLEWHGNEYGDAQFMPPSDSAWEMDLVMETLADGTLKTVGVNPVSTTNRIFIGQSLLTGDGLYGFLGTKLLGSYGTPISDGWHHIRLEFDGSGNGSFVVDNTITYSYTGSDYTHISGESFFLGARSRGGSLFDGELSAPTGYFQYTNKARTADERTADYAKAKAMHPTLP